MPPNQNFSCTIQNFQLCCGGRQLPGYIFSRVVECSFTGVGILEGCSAHVASSLQNY